jgi:hypothetical protein
MTIMKTHSFWLRLSVATLTSSSVISLATYNLGNIPLTSQAIERQKLILNDNQSRIAKWWQSEVENIGQDLSNPELHSRSLNILQAKRHSKSDITSENSQVLESILSSHSKNRNSASLLTKGGIVVFSTNHKRYAAYQPLKNTTTTLELFELPRKPLNFFTDSITGLPSISVALPIHSEAKARAGFLAIDLNLQMLNKQVLDNSTALQGSADSPGSYKSYLVARTSLDQATFIAPPDSSQSDYKFKPLDSAGITKALDGISGQGLYLNSDGIPVIGVYQFLPNFRTALLVESPQSEVYASSRHKALKIFEAGVILSLGFLLAGLTIGRRKDKLNISAPLHGS